MPNETAVRRLALLGNHLPRQCGIATFTTDLSDAIASVNPDLDCFVVAMNDGQHQYPYPGRVRFELTESDSGAYRRAADFLNVNAVDVISVQHEYGIFGGKAGGHLLPLLRELRMPIVTTLHTILAAPNLHQRRVMDEITTLSDRLVVMTAGGADLLRKVHGVDEEKIDVIPHGIPNIPFAGSKNRLGVEGRPLILTFGLLSPDKGIENVIDALPAILALYPDVVYIVLGATHPHVIEHDGETYRLMLEDRAKRLGVDGNVIFHNRFASQSELSEFLAAADIYITPYLNPEQITSGTLAYALGAGKAVISTPYAYARELLAEGRGILVPWKDPSAIAAEIVALLDDPDRRLDLRRRAAEHGRAMLWPSVAHSYLQTFERASKEHEHRARSAFRAQTLATRPADLPNVNLDHVEVMTDATGMLQHASFNVPRYEEGYCLDDNARALLLMTLVEEAGTSDTRLVRALASRYLAFVSHAFDRPRGRFRNFMSYSRLWLEEQGSEDSQGRALWALGTVVGCSADPGRQSLSGALFHAALPAVSSFNSPRAWAFTLLGIEQYLHAFEGDRHVQEAGRAIADRLFQLFRRTNQPDWPWCENRVTYCNARLPQALIATGSWAEDESMIATGLRSLEWLMTIQRTPDGYFAPIGTDGFFERGMKAAVFDQQPVDACATVSACMHAFRATGDHRWAEHARHAFTWFLGQNQLQRSLYDPLSGGCRDALHADRVNENEGAESTLSFLLSLMEMRKDEVRWNAMQIPVPEPAAEAFYGREPGAMTASASHYDVLFHRSEKNPILTAADWPYPVHTVFNAGATLLRDGTTLLLCRVEDRRGHSHLCAARSADGVSGWVIDSQPTLRGDPEQHPEEQWGIEDARITFVPELGKYAVAYTAFGKGGPGVSLALTEDFVHFERCGLVMQPDDKDAALLPRRIDGKFALVHRPIADSGAHVWISYSPDLRSWGGHRMMLQARRGSWWDANKVGLSPPLIETERGWLMLYHGVRQTAAGCLYRLGVALFDLEEPERLLLRGDEWIFGPEAPYETQGDVAYVAFPCGTTIGPDGDTLNLYYGAADTSVAMARGSVRGILEWLDRRGSA